MSRNAETRKLSNVEGVRDPGPVELGPSELQGARQEHWAGLPCASDRWSRVSGWPAAAVQQIDIRTFGLR